MGNIFLKKVNVYCIFHMSKGAFLYVLPSEKKVNKPLCS